jgi:organic radical activating enzyme
VCETFEPDRILEETGVPVYLQPCDGKEFVESLRRALELSRARKTRLSLQTHKILGVR